MNYFKKIFFALLLVSFAIVVNSQDVPKKPVPATLVSDYTNTLTPDQKQTLESKLVAFDDSTSTQVAVVIIETTGDYDIGEYAVKLGREWGIGGKEFNNGVLLLIAKKDRRLHIATGYGIEGALPDITTKHIIDDVIRPNFKGDDYYGGISQGTDAIIKAAKGEYKAPENYNRRGKAVGGVGKIIFFVIIIIVVLALKSGGGGGGGSFMSRRGAMPFILGNLLGGGGGGFGGGGGSSGGGSSGGFGGFGGGSFGGGGSSGSW